MKITTENTFETAIVQSLIEHGGYNEGSEPHYSSVKLTINGLYKTAEKKIEFAKWN